MAVLIFFAAYLFVSYFMAENHLSNTDICVVIFKLLTKRYICITFGWCHFRPYSRRVSNWFKALYFLMNCVLGLVSGLWERSGLFISMWNMQKVTHQFQGFLMTFILFKIQFLLVYFPLLLLIPSFSISKIRSQIFLLIFTFISILKTKQNIITISVEQWVFMVTMSVALLLFYQFSG